MDEMQQINTMTSDQIALIGARDESRRQVDEAQRASAFNTAMEDAKTESVFQAAQTVIGANQKIGQLVQAAAS